MNDAKNGEKSDYVDVIIAVEKDFFPRQKDQHDHGEEEGNVDSKHIQ